MGKSEEYTEIKEQLVYEIKLISTMNLVLDISECSIFQNVPGQISKFKETIAAIEGWHTSRIQSQDETIRSTIQRTVIN